jgi:hypothetical protein
MFYPGYRIRLLLHDKSITSKFSSIIIQARQDSLLKSYILKKTKWSELEFNKVDWPSHERAFRKLTHHLQISAAKLLHNLVNTNRQNYFYYQQSPLCPGCSQSEETLEHVLTCNWPAIKEFWTQQPTLLSNQLLSICTPTPVHEAISQGFQDWLFPPAMRSKSPVYGSLHGPDIILTSAYYEHFHQLGWFQFFLGRSSTLWSKAVEAYLSDRHTPLDTAQWSSQLVTILWAFTRNLWQHQNKIVHGSTIEEAVCLQMATLHDKVRHHFAAFVENPSYVLQRHQFLFTQKPLEARLKMSYDSFQCWICSVDEARQVLQYHDAHLLQSSVPFFQSFHNPTATHLQDHSISSDSTYDPSTHLTSDSLTLYTEHTATTQDATTISGTLLDDDSISTHSSATVVLNGYFTPDSFPS